MTFSLNRQDKTGIRQARPDGVGWGSYTASTFNNKTGIRQTRPEGVGWGSYIVTTFNDKTGIR